MGLTRPLIFLLIVFTSFVLLTKAEEGTIPAIRVIKNSTLDHEENLRNKLLETLTSLTYFSQEGLSSFYGSKFHGRKTASGQKFSKSAYTAAHRSLPFGTIIKVTNTDNFKSSLAIINDRGPFVRKRIIDISHKVASHIGSSGIPPVSISGISNKTYDDSASFKDKFIVFPIIQGIQIADLSDINFLKQMDDFSESVELIHELQELNPNVPYCLVVSANEYFSSKFDRNYYIGILISGSRLANRL